MQFLNIQDLLSKQINFSQFGIKHLSAEEKDLLVLFLQGKIDNTNERFERMINNEKLSMILTILHGDESNMKSLVIDEIKNLNLMKTFSSIKKENLDMYQIIRKYNDDLSPLLNSEFDLTLSNKYVIIHIQYVLSVGYKKQDIFNTIEKVKATMEMEEEMMLEGIEEDFLNMDTEDFEEDEEAEIRIEQDINQLMTNLSIEGVEHKEDMVTHISKLQKYEDMISIFRNTLKNNYNLIPFFQRLVKPMFSEQYVSINILQALIEKVIKDDDLSQSLKQYILQSIVSFMNYKEE